MTNARLPALATIALVAGPVMFLRGFKHFRTYRLIENTPTARIRSMAMGLVELNGKVQGRSRVFSPFSGRECVFWQVDVAARGRRRDGWSIIHRNQSGSPFYLEDDTGVALVFPHGSECKIRFATDEECSGLNIPDVYADYLRENHVGLSPITRLGQLRFRERVLEDDMQVYVLGTAAPRSRAIVVSDGEAMAATGTDGPFDRRRMERDHAVCALVRQGENEKTFIVSQESERELAFGLRTKAVAMIWGGPLLALFGLGYWLLEFASRHWLK